MAFWILVEVYKVNQLAASASLFCFCGSRFDAGILPLPRPNLLGFGQFSLLQSLKEDSPQPCLLTETTTMIHIS